jgi:HlyD family secretion protein
VEQGKAALAVARGNLARAKAQADDAVRQAERNRKLVEGRLISQSDADTTDTNLAMAKASVQAAEGAVTQAQAALHQAELNLFYTAIVSPIDGTVISRSVDVGQTVAASLSSPVLFEIAQDLRKMQVDTSVAEADVGRLAAGMPARFTVDAYPNETFEGNIREIRNAPQTVQNVVTYDAVIDVENPDLKLKPGMTANVTVTYATRDGVLRVPNTALRFRPPEELTGKTSPAKLAPDQRQVWVQRGPGKADPVVLQIGVSDGTLTEVVKGELAEGDEVVVEAISGKKSGPGSFGRIF